MLVKVHVPTISLWNKYFVNSCIHCEMQSHVLSFLLAAYATRERHILYTLVDLNNWLSANKQQSLIWHTKTVACEIFGNSIAGRYWETDTTNRTESVVWYIRPLFHLVTMSSGNIHILTYSVQQSHAVTCISKRQREEIFILLQLWKVSIYF